MAPLTFVTLSHRQAERDSKSSSPVTRACDQGIVPNYIERPLIVLP